MTGKGCSFALIQLFQRQKKLVKYDSLRVCYREVAERSATILPNFKSVSAWMSSRRHLERIPKADRRENTGPTGAHVSSRNLPHGPAAYCHGGLQQLLRLPSFGIRSSYRSSAPSRRADFERMTARVSSSIAPKSGHRRPSCACSAQKLRKTPTCQNRVFGLCAGLDCGLFWPFLPENSLGCEDRRGPGLKGLSFS